MGNFEAANSPRWFLEYLFAVKASNLKENIKHDKVKQLLLARIWCLTFNVQIDRIALSVSFQIAAHARVQTSSSPCYWLQHQALVAYDRTNTCVVEQRLSLKQRQRGLLLHRPYASLASVVCSFSVSPCLHLRLGAWVMSQQPRNNNYTELT